MKSTASDSAASSETEKLLDDAIAHLGERDRNAVLLRFFAGRSLREVGEVMGVSEDAAKNRIFRHLAIEEGSGGYFKISVKGITAESATITASLGMAVKPAGPGLAHAAVRLAAAKAAAGATISNAGFLSRLGWPKLAAGIARHDCPCRSGGGEERGGQTARTPPHAQAQSHTTPIIMAAPLLADAAPPAPQPLDQSTPVNVLKKLSEAMKRGDRLAIAECICDDGDDADTAAAAHAYFLEQASLWRLTQVWQAKFNDEMGYGKVTNYFLPSHKTFELLLSNTLDFPGGLKVKIDGDIAQVRVPLPPKDFIVPGRYQQGAAFGHWSGGLLVCKQVDRNWKLDTDRTFDFLIHVARHPGNNKCDMALMAEVCTKVADGLDTIADDIASGKITTSQDANDAVNVSADRAFTDADTQSVWWMPLPVTSVSDPAARASTARAISSDTGGGSSRSPANVKRRRPIPMQRQPSDQSTPGKGACEKLCDAIHGYDLKASTCHHRLSL